MTAYSNTARLRRAGWALSTACALTLAFATAPVVAESIHPQNETLAGEPASDAVLTTEIKARLNDLETIKSQQVSVDVNDGVVTLEGAVPSEADRLALEREIKAVEGVKMVVNSLEVEG
jgi:osmotically-inducible protein OsmY